MGFSQGMLCMKVILKAFKLKGHIETPKESMWETILPSILRHHAELCCGSMIKYDLESDIPALTTTWKFRLSVRVSFLCKVKHLCILQQINVNFCICIIDIKNNSCPVGCTQKQLPCILLCTVSFKPLLLYSFSKVIQSRILFSLGNQHFIIIHLFERHNGSKFFVFGSRCRKEMTLDSVGFTERKGGISFWCVCSHLFPCASFIKAPIKQQSCCPWKWTCWNFFIAMIK